MRKAKIQFRGSSISAIEDAWQRRATANAIAEARRVITAGIIPPAVQIGRLSDQEWGYIAAAIIFGWIATRAEQASAEGIEAERTIRDTNITLDPWDAGVIIAILPELAERCADLDWKEPLSAWAKATMAKFLLEAIKLIGPAMRARDLSGCGVTQEVTKLNDPIPS
jgi:hypothetical protein